METDIKDEPWFSGGFPVFDHSSWQNQKTPLFWSSNYQKIPEQPGRFQSSTPFTANNAMFGYTQPGFVSSRSSVIGHGVNNIYNSFLAPRPTNWFNIKNSQFNTTDFPTTIGTHIRFQPTFQTEPANNNTKTKVRFQAITSMSEYCDKSFEELRLEDYITRKQHIQQAPSSNFIRPDLIQNDVAFFDAILRNKSNTLSNQFCPSDESNGLSNIMPNVTNKCSEPSLLTNTSFLLEYLLNHVKHRLNLHLISDKARHTCEKLTTKLAEYTEKTLETITVVVLEDILTNIKEKVQIPVPGTSLSAPKVSENELLSECDLVTKRNTKKKPSHCGTRKAERGVVTCVNSSNGCSRPIQASKNEVAIESEDDGCSGTNSVTGDWCCISKHQAVPKKHYNRQYAECRCETREKLAAGCTAIVDDDSGGNSRTKGTRRSSYGDCCGKEGWVRRKCGSKCVREKCTTLKSASRRCHMAKRLDPHFSYDNEFYIRERLKNVTVDTDDGEDVVEAADGPHKEKLMARCKTALADDFHALSSAAIGTATADKDEEKVIQPRRARDSQSGGTDESDFSSV